MNTENELIKTEEELRRITRKLDATQLALIKLIHAVQTKNEVRIQNIIDECLNNPCIELGIFSAEVIALYTIARDAKFLMRQYEAAGKVQRIHARRLINSIKIWGDLLEDGIENNNENDN